MQLKLHLPQIPLPHEQVWEHLSTDQQAALIEALAQLIAKAAAHETPEEMPDE
jgi:hypothetical protein